MNGGQGTLVMVNPAAGGGRGARQWRLLRAKVPEIAEAAAIEPAGAPEARAELRRRLLEDGHERLLIIGGDGTAQLAANVLLELEAERLLRASDVALAVVPAGTGSDLARHLELPRDPQAALRHVLSAKPRPLDAIAFTTDDGRRRAVLNTASFGLSGSVVREINANPKRGALSYLAATLRGLLRYRPASCRVEADGALLGDGPFFLVAVTNGRYFGKGMKVAPAAVSDDGLAEVVLVPPVPRWQLPLRLPQFFTGRHVALPFVTVRRARQVRLLPAEDAPPFELDGEAADAAPATLEVLPGALRILY